MSGRGPHAAWVIGYAELLRYQREGLLPLGAKSLAVWRGNMPRERVWEGLPVETLVHAAANIAASGVAQKLCPTNQRKPRTPEEWKALHAIEEKVFPVIEDMMRTLVEEVILAVVESPAR